MTGREAAGLARSIAHTMATGMAVIRGMREKGRTKGLATAECIVGGLECVADYVEAPCEGAAGTAGCGGERPAEAERCGAPPGGTAARRRRGPDDRDAAARWLDGALERTEARLEEWRAGTTVPDRMVDELETTRNALRRVRAVVGHP